MNSHAQGIPLNCGSIIGTNAPVYTFRKPNIGGDAFRLLASPITRTVSVGTSGIINQKDLVLISNSGATTITDYQVSLQQLIPGSYNTTIYSNNSGIIISPNIAGLSSGIASGSASLFAISTEGSFSSVNVVVSGIVGTTSTSYQTYSNTSLSKHTSDAIDNRIASKNPTTTKPIYSTQNHNSAIYVRNNSCWTESLNLTPISPWNSTGGNTRGGTLISPRHILFAAHYQIENNATIRFVDMNNNVITRTMINKLTHPSYTPYYPDITVGVLDSDVPATINFAKILPTNWLSYLPSLSIQYRIPALVIDQEEKALISELYELATSAKFFSPNNNTRLLFYESIITGDSGNPAFLIINNELVIITVWTYGGAGSGTNIQYHQNAINTMMATLGGGYSLTEIDLSGFSTYN